MNLICKDSIELHVIKVMASSPKTLMNRNLEYLHQSTEHKDSWPSIHQFQPELMTEEERVLLRAYYGMLSLAQAFRTWSKHKDTSKSSTGGSQIKASPKKTKTCTSSTTHWTWKWIPREKCTTAHSFWTEKPFYTFSFFFSFLAIFCLSRH